MKTKNKFPLVFFFLILPSFKVFAQQPRQDEGCSIYNLRSLTGVNCNQFEHGEWLLVFEDNFDGSQINSDIWFTCEDNWNRRHGTELQYYKDENIVVDNGILHLVAREEPGMYPVWVFEGNEGHQEDMYFRYTSGWIQTKYKYEYGLIEVRCKIPEGTGFWPAFWLFGDGYEVDVFEFAGDRPDKCNFNAHKWYDNSLISCEGQTTSNSPFSNDYHVYSIEWDEFYLVYRIDGIIKHQLSRFINRDGHEIPNCNYLHNGRPYYDLELFPREPMSIILNLAISDGSYCPPPTFETTFPSSLDIDYIRVYKKKSPNRFLTLNQNYDTTVDCYLGGTILVEPENGVFEVKANQKLKLFAENEVEIKPETEFYYGSNVEIHINSDTRASETTLINDTLVYYNQGFGSASETEQDDISIIPNPSNGHFSINLNSQWKRYDKLLILNQKGNVILERSIGDLQKYDFSLHAETGTYYILIEGAKGLVKKKLIIK